MPQGTAVGGIGVEGLHPRAGRNIGSDSAGDGARAPAGPSHGSAFRGDVQGLRAIAVLSVVLYHAGVPFFGGGYVGVDVFFVISGYLITGLLLREIEQTGTIRFVAFYARRIRRLLPAVTLVLVATTIATHFLLSTLDQHELVPSILSSALYVSNFWFARQASDYLGGDVRTNPVMHTWSLSVEEQFYVVWPLLLLLGAFVGRPDRRRGRLAVIMASVVVISFGASVWALDRSKPWAFFGSPFRAWEFALGALVCLGEARMSDLVRRAGPLLGLAGLLAIMGAVARFGDGTTFPGVAALLPVIGAGLLLAAGSADRRGALERGLGSLPMRTLGDLSYSWYLWHWPLLVFPLALGITLGPLARAGAVVASLALAWASYRWVENPVRFNATLMSSPRRSIALGATLTLVAVAAGLAVQQSSERTIASSRAVYLRVRDDLPAIYPTKCHAEYTASIPPRCVFGDTTATRSIYLIGDSHAGQWFPALDSLARSERWRLVSLTKSACPAADVVPFHSTLGRKYRECAEWREQTMRRIESDRPALVVVSHIFGYIKDPVNQVTEAEWTAGMHASMSRLRRAGAAVAVIRDTPRPSGDLPRCLAFAALHKRPTSSCDLARDSTWDGRLFRLDRAASAGLDRIAFVDLDGVLCPGTTCASTTKDGWPVFRDAGHLSARMSRSLAPALRDRLVAAGVFARDSSGGQPSAARR